ncbi:MAG: hypothetical protein Q9169_001366 [Polycauliona sp. 2 TL-2023]
MTQTQAHGGSDYLAIALRGAKKSFKLGAYYLTHVKFQLSKRKFYPSIPGQLSVREDEARGFLALPREIRLQILEEVLVPGIVYPYRDMIVFQKLEQDWQIIIATHLQTWKDFIRNPSVFRLRSISNLSSRCSAVRLATEESLYPINAVPRCLPTCRTIFCEGLELFYSKNKFLMEYGPLSISRDYYERLQPKHKRLIRRLEVKLHWCDLTFEALNHIEDQLRAKDVAHGRLPPDDSVEDWVPPAVYQVMSIWRSKLAWLQEWTWLEYLRIYSCLRDRKFLERYLLHIPKVRSIKVKGKRLPKFLQDIGPIGPHCPVIDCYRDCNKSFAKQMRAQEELTWKFFTILIAADGWKAFKASIRAMSNSDIHAARRRIR